MDKTKREVIRMLLAEFAMEAEDYDAAFVHLQKVCIGWPSSVAVSNLFCRLVAKSNATRPNMKFLSSLRAKDPSSLPLMLLMGHSHSLQVGAPLHGWFTVAETDFKPPSCPPPH